jgi:hypothetical protein
VNLVKGVGENVPGFVKVDMLCTSKALFAPRVSVGLRKGKKKEKEKKMKETKKKKEEEDDLPF